MDNGLDLSDLTEIGRLSDRNQQYWQLLLLRHTLTDRIASSGVLYPPLILQRALVYEALYYSDLAAADAFVTYTLCEVVRNDEWVSDLEAKELSGEPWPSPSLGDTRTRALQLEIHALALLCRSLKDLGATQDAEEKRLELVDRISDLQYDGKREDVPGSVVDELLKKSPVSLYSNDQAQRPGVTGETPSRFGMSRREIYPWNKHEPDRNSAESLSELNRMLLRLAPDLEARVSILPALDGTAETWHQLGLFARRDLAPMTVILQEKSILTGIRPLDDALCDACGADLESSTTRDEMRQCPGQDCDATFCSQDCATRAYNEYHRPNVEETEDYGEVKTEDDDNNNDENNDEKEGEEEEEEEYEDDDNEDSDYPPARAPFCGNTALSEIGRTSSSDTPEWDLYFLLLTRTIQMSTTQSVHPLELPAIKYLWGDFAPIEKDRNIFSPDHVVDVVGDEDGKEDEKQEEDRNPSSSTRIKNQASKNSSSSNNKAPVFPQLPFSLYHNIGLPLQYFETVMHSLPETHRPYSAGWLGRYDFWILQTLTAKFRGVANAQQSTFDGKAEIAAVHPCWSLANHSCAPNVDWTPTGLRQFRVRNRKIKNKINIKNKKDMNMNMMDGHDDDDKAGIPIPTGLIVPDTATDADMLPGPKDQLDDNEFVNKDHVGIKKGEEIWSHYTDVRLDVRERRERLKEVLGGLCRCTRCLQESEETS